MHGKLPAPQRFVVISIDGVQTNGRVFYSYTSPIFGTTVINSPKCDIYADQATYTLYLLDFASTMNGWIIKKISSKGESPEMKTEMGPKHLSILTVNDYDPPNATYDFYIHYHNTVTGQDIMKDPQEGNIPPPTQTDPR